MVVYILDNAPETLRGELCKWVLEVKSGVFVGKLSRVVREKLWDKISKEDMRGALMIYKINTEQGYKIEMIGEPYRSVIDLDGIQLIERKFQDK